MKVENTIKVKDKSFKTLVQAVGLKIEEYRKNKEYEKSDGLRKILEGMEIKVQHTPYGISVVSKDYSIIYL